MYELPQLVEVLPYVCVILVLEVSIFHYIQCVSDISAPFAKLAFKVFYLFFTGFLPVVDPETETAYQNEDN